MCRMEREKDETRQDAPRNGFTWTDIMNKFSLVKMQMCDCNPIRSIVHHCQTSVRRRDESYGGSGSGSLKRGGERKCMVLGAICVTMVF